MIEKKEDNGKFFLEFTNGDIEKYDAVMQKYNFKDAQAFIRFATSILLVAENKEIQIKKNNYFVAVAPIDDLINNA